MEHEMDCDVLVVGGGYAGVMAANRAARGAPGARVTLVSANDGFVDRIRLHQAAAGQTLPPRSMRALLDGSGTRFVRATVTRIEPAARRVRIRDAAGERSLGFGRLIYALGSQQDLHAVPGATEHALGLDRLGARSLIEQRTRLHELATRGGRAVVVGGGLTGIELASELAESFTGLAVTIVCADSIGEGISSAGLTHLQAAFARWGVRVRERVAVRELRADGARLADGSTEPYDVCFWAGPFAVPSLAREAGLSVNARGQVLVDAALRSCSHPQVYAAGDAAAPSVPSGARVGMACATAIPMGTHAGDNAAAEISGRAIEAFDFSYVLRCVSLGRRDALVQTLDPQGAPRERVYTGRLAAWIKEGICRGVIFAIRTGMYSWRGRTRGAVAELASTRAHAAGGMPA